MKAMIISMGIYMGIGMVVAVRAVIEAVRNDEFDPKTARGEDEEAIGQIVLSWPIYLHQKKSEK